MASRIDIELTSARSDGTWTWRAAGARQPRGTLEGSLLPEGAKAGDVLRAEAEFEIDGITIISLQAPREKRRESGARIDVIGTPAGPPVTTQLARRGPRRDGDRPPRRDGDRPPRRDGDRPPRREGEERPRRSAAQATERTRQRPGADQGGERPRGGEARGDGRADAISPAVAGARGGGRRRERPGQRAPRPEGAAEAGPQGAPPGNDRDVARRARRLSPATTHRAAVLAALPPEQVPVAEQVLRGGIPAVRTAIHLEREKAASEGRPPPNAEALLAMAEDLLPRLKAAEWRDRAEAAARAPEDIALRDLRSVVAGADLARDDDTRALAASLRESLERRVAAMRDEWVDEVTRHLDQGRVVRALRLAGRPPDAQTRLSAELATRLGAAAGEAMASDVPSERWLAVLEAVAASPVRRSVQPAGLPDPASPEVLRAAQQQSGRVPALAAMLGIAIPPPPGPVRGAGRRPASARPSRPSATRRPAPRPAAGDAGAPTPDGGAPPANGRAGGPPAVAGESPPPPAVPHQPPPEGAQQSAPPPESQQPGTGAAAPEPAPPDRAPERQAPAPADAAAEAEP